MKLNILMLSAAVLTALGCGGQGTPGSPATTSTGGGATTTATPTTATPTTATPTTATPTAATPTAATPTAATPSAGGSSPSGEPSVSGGSGNSTAGSATASGATTNGASTGDTAPAAEGSCTITLNAEVSEAIQTVGIVTFSADVSVDQARIEFGLDTNYGMTAPVDLSEPEYRTLLLGMKQSREYHFRIVVESGGAECASADQTLMTGLLPNILPQLDVNTIAPEALWGGFLETGQYQARGGDTSPAYILDADGDYVWALAVGDYVTGVRQSYDGKYMWINGTNNTNGGKANIHRVTMDGLVDEDLSAEFGIQDHSITILPDESVIFYGHDGTCADIKRRYPDGSIEVIVNSGEAHGAPGMCHINHIEYSPDDETLIFGDDNHDNYTKITLDGQVVWVLGGETSQFTGDGATWSRNHGLDVLAVDRVLHFNNGPMRGTSASMVRELQLDLEAMTATVVWTYEPDPPLTNDVLGDVQRLDNGNTVVAFSAQGVLHEVDADGNLLQEITWPLGGAFGYINKRRTLYGPPPR